MDVEQSVRCSTDKKVKERTRDTHEPRRIVVTGDWRAPTIIQATARGTELRSLLRKNILMSALSSRLFRGRQPSHISVTRTTFQFYHRTLLLLLSL